MTLRAHEVVRALSLREFTALCAVIDEFGPKTVTRACTDDGSGVSKIYQEVGGVLREKKFDVLRVTRPEHGPLRVKVFFGHKADIAFAEYEIGREEKLCKSSIATSSTRVA